MMIHRISSLHQAMLVAGGLSVVLASPVQAGNYLSESMEVFAIEHAKEWTGVGAIYNAADPANGQSAAIFNGSASLINPGDNDGDGFDDTDIAWVLTAAHVLDGADVRLFGTGDSITNALLWEVDSWYIPATYLGNVMDGGDIALVKLSQVPDAHIDRYNLYRGGTDVGSEFLTVGFGENGTGSYLLSENGAGVFFDGHKRAGRNRYDDTAGIHGEVIMSDFDIDPDDELYTTVYENYYRTINTGFIFDDQQNPRVNGEADFRIPFEFAPDNGDSGGAQFIGDEIASVTSFGQFPWAPPSGNENPNNVDEPVPDGDSDGHFGSRAGYIRTNAWADWIYTIINKVENDVVLDETGDNVLLGTPGVPIEVTPPDPNNPSVSAAAAMASILTDYFDPNIQLGLRDSLALMGRPLAAGEDLTIEAAADKLGIDPATLPSDPFAAFDALLAEANSVLDQVVDPSWEGMTQSGFDDKYGFYLGRDYEVGTFDLNGAITFDPTLLDDAPDLLLGDIDVDGDIDDTDIDLVAVSIRDPKFREWTDVDFDGENTLGDFTKIVTALAGILIGDGNFSGSIEQGDLDAVLQNWGSQQAGWASGDYTGDGRVDQSDLDIVLQNWGSVSAPVFDPNLVPEPSTLLALMSMGTLAMLRRRSA